MSCPIVNIRLLEAGNFRPTRSIMYRWNEVERLSEAIIQARAIEKFYAQPDGKRIQVVAPVDLSIEPGRIIALLGPTG